MDGLGCFNRPWNQHEFEDALAGIRAAGFELVGFMRQRGRALLDANSTPGDVGRLKAACERQGLVPSTNLAGLQLEADLDDAVADFKRVIDNTRAVGCDLLLTCGTMNEAQYDAYYEVMRQTADYAQRQGVMLTLKPHGGISATSRELLNAVEEVSHPNFGIYYDPGNIHFYTGESAAQDVKLIAEHVVAMCIKDETGGLKGKVMIEPGTGDVDWDAVFGTLRDAGFSGPCLVECLGGETLEELNESAKRAHEFLVRHLT